MKAIILCCDKYLSCAYHTIKSYESSIPNNDFVYLLPYNESVPDFIKQLRIQTQKRIKLIFTNPQFKKTMKKLLKNIDDEEFIYWCSSDTYIEKIDVQKFLILKNLISSGFFNDFDVISPFYNKKIHNNIHNLQKKKINNFDFVLCPKWDKPIFNIWQHQFMKVKILKAIWNSFNEPNKAKDLDKQLMKINHPIYDNLAFINCKNIYLQNPILKLGENTSRGFITSNAIENFHKLNINTDIIQLPINYQCRLIW